MKLRYAPRAKADIAEIHAYIADRNAKAATAVIRRLKAAAELLAQFPGVGRATDIPGVRVLPAPPRHRVRSSSSTSATRPATSPPAPICNQLSRASASSEASHVYRRIPARALAQSRVARQRERKAPAALDGASQARATLRPRT